MGSCFKENEVEEPLWALEFKDYDTAELNNLIYYANQALTWFQANGLNTSNEDIIGFRVGVPLITNTDILETDTLYATTGDYDQLVRSISLDCLKISTKVYIDGVEFSQPYTFKSAFNHDIFKKYFFEGVENHSGLTYLDTYSMKLTDESGIQVKYGGVNAKLRDPLPVPDDVYAAMVYVIQNATLATTTTENTEIVKKGDIAYYTTSGFYTHLTNIKDKAVEIVNKVATPYQEDIHELLVYLGMDQAFRDVRFGGDFTDMRVAMRIPASRANQFTLEGLLHSYEEFNDIFKVRTFDHNDIDIDSAEKKEDLLDPYSNDKMDWPELDDNIYGYGCSGTFYYNTLTQQYYPTSTDCEQATIDYYGAGYDPVIHLPGLNCRATKRYRYWYISQDWLNTLTPEQLSIVFWMGLDITTERGDPCPLDELLSIIIVIVMTYLTAGIGSSTSLTIMQGLTVISGIVQIAAITGVIDTKTAKILGALLAVASLGTSLTNAATTATSVMKQAISIANQVLDTVQAFEQEAFIEEVESLKDQIEKAVEDADLYESNLRFTYGGAFEMGVRQGPEADPYQYLKDTYKPYTIYTTAGFK